MRTATSTTSPPLETHRRSALPLRALLLFGLLTTVLASEPRAEPQAGPDRILNELLTVHPYSKPGSLLSTADGTYLYRDSGAGGRNASDSMVIRLVP